MSRENHIQLPIKGFLELSLLDWQGKVASVMFLGGCNFRCPYCHNGQLIQPAAPLPDIPLGHILEHTEKHRGWIDGVVITGGEPTIHAGLPELIQTVKQAGWGVKLDTNGSNPDMLEKLISGGWVDYVAMDVKAPLNDIDYARAAGGIVNLEYIRRSIDLLMQKNIVPRLIGGLQNMVEYEFRTTVCPNLLDERKLVSLLESIQGARRLFLQNFHPAQAQDPGFRQIQAFTREQLEKFAGIASGYVQYCNVKA